MIPALARSAAMVWVEVPVGRSTKVSVLGPMGVRKAKAV